jgi:hypothetical protein
VRTISEPDWKVFRRLHPIAVERYFDRLMAEIGGAITDTTKTTADRYYDLRDYLREVEKERAWLLDDFRRSTALEHIAAMFSRGLWTEEEYAGFSAETRNLVTVLCQVYE